MCRDFGIDSPVVFLIIINILFQNPLSLGHSHHMCDIVTLMMCEHPLKQRGEADGYNFVNLVGTRYHCVKTFRSASIRDVLRIP